MIRADLPICRICRICRFLVLALALQNANGKRVLYPTNPSIIRKFHNKEMALSGNPLPLPKLVMRPP
jgi:hypothetical protein